MGLLVFITAAFFNYTTPQVELSVTVEEPGGSVFYAIYNSEESYMKEPFSTGSKEVEDGKALIVLDLEPGTYAITFFQDLNGNGELDTNWIGIPNEPYAFSNNARGSMGPASFKDSKFTVTENASFKIQIK